MGRGGSKAGPLRPGRRGPRASRSWRDCLRVRRQSVKAAGFCPASLPLGLNTCGLKAKE